jgi:putative transposase
VIVVEDLHVAGLLRNRRLARAIADQGWAQFHRQLAYKCQWYGSRLLVAPRWFPSSKLCSDCGLVIDRDPNAARNLTRLADGDAGPVAASSAETRTPVERVALARPATAWCNCPRRSRNGLASRLSKMRRLR